MSFVFSSHVQKIIPLRNSLYYVLLSFLESIEKQMICIILLSVNQNFCRLLAVYYCAIPILSRNNVTAINHLLCLVLCKMLRAVTTQWQYNIASCRHRDIILQQPMLIYGNLIQLII